MPTPLFQLTASPDSGALFLTGPILKKYWKKKPLIEAQYIQSQKVEAIGRLAGGIAHDLNNMLSPIIGFAELLMLDISSEGRQRESLEQILRAGHKARGLVHQLLGL